jgi:hypothetical protein
MPKTMRRMLCQVFQETQGAVGKGLEVQHRKFSFFRFSIRQRKFTVRGSSVLSLVTTCRRL